MDTALSQKISHYSRKEFSEGQLHRKSFLHVLWYSSPWDWIKTTEVLLCNKLENLAFEKKNFHLYMCLIFLILFRNIFRCFIHSLLIYYRLFSFFFICY